MKREIIEIAYPTTVIPPEQQRYIVGNTCKAIINTSINGEMAMIGCYEVELNDGTFIEIKASEVIVRYKKIAEETDNNPF